MLLENVYEAPVSLFNNYNYYKYDTLGRLTRKGYIGQSKEYNSATSTWSTVQNGNYKEYVYNKNGQVITEADEESNITQYKYTPEGKLLSTLDPANKDRNLSFTVSYVYDTLGRVTQENYIDSLNSTTGKIVTYEYTTQSVGSVIKTYTITKRVNLTENGGVLEINKYDLLGNVITHTECKGGVPYDWEYEYNNFGKIALSKEPYKSGGVLKQIQKKYQYNSLGMLVYVQNMMDTPTATGDDVCDLYSYNLVSGNLLSSCHQNYNGTDAITISATYDKNSNQLTSTDGNGVTVTYGYDEIDRKVSESVTIDTVEHKDVIDYDLNGNITRTVDWRGNSWYYSYDSMNRLYEKEDPYNTVYEKLEYDARNLQVSSYDANDKKTEYTYDKNKRLTSTLDPLSHTQSQTYDNLGNIKEKIDGRNNQIVYKYDIMGRVEEVYDSTVLKSKYTYYIDGALKEQKIGNATTNYVTTYTYNPFGMVESITDPTETGVPTTTETYEYYPTGAVKSKIDRNGKTTTYEYDCHDRMLKQTTGDSNNSITITIPNTTSDKGYDGNGNLKKVILEKKVSGTVVSTITTERIYDDLDRVATKKETSVEDGVTTVIGPVTYTYDLTSGVLDGEVKEQSSYPGSNIVTKVYDCAGRLKSVSDGQQTDYEYDANGRRDSITYNDTFKQTYTYYDDGLLDELTNLVKNSSGVYVESEYYKYYYDAAHNMTGKDERISGTTKTTTYEYDSMNRLETVAEPGKTTEYTFDSRGNRETVTVTEGSDVTYTLYEYTNNNRLKYETKRNDGPTGTIIQKKQYTYDNNGNLTAITDITGTPSVITTNTYTLINQLENSTTAGNTMKNTYNAEGKRVSKALNTGSPTRYFYEGNKAVFEYANGGTVTAFNVIGANLISRKIGTNKVYYSYNGHGDVTALLDAATKNKRAQYAYDAFGNVTDEKYYDSNGNITTNPENTIKSPIRYGEYQYDSETEYTDAQGNFVTGLYYLNARHYDPGTARFLEVDTYSGNIADPLSLNLYTYCRNEPIMYTDPTGHYTQGNLLSYESGQQQNYDPDVWELQRDLMYLGYMNREEIPSGREGYYDPATMNAVNAFKNTHLSGGNTGNNVGKVGDTTWLYIKREVNLKNLEGMAKNDNFAKAKAAIWDDFYSSYDKLIAKPKSSSSTSGNTFDYGKSVSSNPGTSNGNLTVGGYVGVHKVLGDNYHSSIIIVIDKNSIYYNDDRFLNYGEDSGMKYSTIGAGSKGLTPILPGRDKLISDVNRKKDADLTIKVQYIPIEINDEKIAELFELRENYEKNNKESKYAIEYDLFPKKPNAHNSNSFISGLLNAAGFTNVPTPTNNVPGWSKPVPKDMFK